jgi:aspartyl-tRNA(Asn)/glutamyl-tRNA(Gln) amidotransferase subunit A
VAVDDALQHLSATALAEAFRTRRLSPVEVTAATLERIERIDWELASFCFLDPEGAMAAASASEARWARGEILGPLDGVPFSVKDAIWVEGMPSYHGAAGTSESPSVQESCAVTRLREAGAVLLGKTTMAEMGFYYGGVSSRYQGARNPWDAERTAGGSSGGAAAAVAAGLGPIALASDAGGSARLPASFCGVVGLKPSAGRVATLPPGGPTAVVGTVAGTVADTATVLGVVARPDARDHNALPFPPPDYRAECETAVSGLRVGYIPEMGFGEPTAPGVAEAVRAAVGALENKGCKVTQLGPPVASNVFHDFLETTLPLLCGRFSDLTGGRTDLLLPLSRQAVAYGKAVAMDTFVAATGRLAVAVRDFCALTREHNVLVMPTVTRVAFEAGAAFPQELTPHPYGCAVDFASFLPIANAAGLPAVSVPCGFADGLPVGLQVMGRRYDEAGVLRAAAIVERALALDLTPPL